MSLENAGSYHKMVIYILKILAYHFLSLISSGNHLKSLMSSLFASVGHRKLFVKMHELGLFELAWFVKYLVKEIKLGVDVTARYPSLFWYQILFNSPSHKKGLDPNPPK